MLLLLIRKNILIKKMIFISNLNLFSFKFLTTFFSFKFDNLFIHNIFHHNIIQGLKFNLVYNIYAYE